MRLACAKALPFVHVEVGAWRTCRHCPRLVAAPAEVTLWDPTPYSSSQRSTPNKAELGLIQALLGRGSKGGCNRASHDQRQAPACTCSCPAARASHACQTLRIPSRLGFRGFRISGFRDHLPCPQANREPRGRPMF